MVNKILFILFLFSIIVSAQTYDPPYDSTDNLRLWLWQQDTQPGAVNVNNNFRKIDSGYARNKDSITIHRVYLSESVVHRLGIDTIRGLKLFSSYGITFLDSAIFRLPSQNSTLSRAIWSPNDSLIIFYNYQKSANDTIATLQDVRDGVPTITDTADYAYFAGTSERIGSQLNYIIIDSIAVRLIKSSESDGWNLYLINHNDDTLSTVQPRYAERASQVYENTNNVSYPANQIPTYGTNLDINGNYIRLKNYLSTVKDSVYINLSDTSTYVQFMDSSGVYGWYRRAYLNAALNAKQNTISNLADTAKYVEFSDSSSQWYKRNYIDSIFITKGTTQIIPSTKYITGTFLYDGTLNFRSASSTLILPPSDAGGIARTIYGSATDLYYDGDGDGSYSSVSFAGHAHDASAITAGKLAIARGGTNNDSYVANKFLYYNSALGKIMSSTTDSTSLGAGTVTSVALAMPTGFTVSGSPVTTSGTLTASMTAGYFIPSTSSGANWDTAYVARNRWDGGAYGLNATTGRTSLNLGSMALINNNFTANRVIISDGAAELTASSIDTTKLGYLRTLSSSIQEQINAKQATIPNLADTSTYVQFMDSSGAYGWYRRPYLDAVFATKAATSHNHDVSNITTGKFTIARGGTNNTAFVHRKFVYYDDVLDALVSSTNDSTNITASAGGATNDVQYNSSGALAGSTDFTWNNTNKQLNIIGSAVNNVPLTLNVAGVAVLDLKNTTNTITQRFGSHIANTYLGSYTSHDFNIITGNTDRWVFTTDGNFYPYVSSSYDIGKYNRKIDSFYVNNISAYGTAFTFSSTNFVLNSDSGEIKTFGNYKIDAPRTIIDTVFNIRPDSVRLVTTTSDTVITFNSSSVRLWGNAAEVYTLKRISSPVHRQLKDGDRIRIICMGEADGITVQNSSGGSGNIVLTGGAASMVLYSVMEFEYISYLGKWLEIYRRL